MKDKRILSSIAMIATVIIWGLSFISIKVTLNVFPPMTLAVLRFLIAIILLMVILRIKEPGAKINKKDIPMMAMAGFVGVTLYYAFENHGVNLISASAASMIIATIPVFSLIAESFILKTKLTLSKIAGVIFSVVGVYFIVGGNIKELLASSNGLGYLMMLGAVLSWVIYNLITKPLFEKYSQLTIIYYQMIFGTIFLIPFVFFEKTKWNLINTTVTLNVIYLAVFCSAIAYYLYAYALNNLSVTSTSLYLNLSPLVTAVGSYFILQESITKNQIIGGIFVIISVYIVNNKTEIKKETVECIEIKENLT